MTEVKLERARALTATLDRLSRNPRTFAPKAPWIIPVTMGVVAAFAVICIAIKLIMIYLKSKNEKTKDFRHSHNSSPDIPTTPEDQTSMATTASMKTRGSLGLSTRRHHMSRPPPVSLYQIRQKQSPGSLSATKSKTHRAPFKAMSRAARAEANRSLSREKSAGQARDVSDDNMNNTGENSPTNLSHRSDDTDEMQIVNESTLSYGVAASGQVDASPLGGHGSQNQPEVHIVQIRDVETNLQHSQPTWPQAQSDI